MSPFSLSPEVINGLFTLGGAILGALITWLLTRKPEPRQELRVQSSPVSSLAVVSSEFRGKVKLIVGEQEVRDPGSFALLISNVGNRAVTEIKMKMSVSNSAAILAWQIQADSALKEGCKIFQSTPSEADLQIRLLNPGDALELRFMTNQSDTIVEVKYHEPNVIFTHAKEILISGALLQGLAEAIEATPFGGIYLSAFPGYRTWRKRRQDLARNSKTEA